MKYHLLLLLFVVGKLSMGQTCKLEILGQVTAGNERLPGATIFDRLTNKSATTDEQGNFVLTGLCAGKHILEIRFIGYKSIEKEVIVPVREKIKITLEEDQTQLSEVLVTASSTARSSTQLSSALEEETLNQLHGKPLGESLQRIAGVGALQTGPSIFKPVIHGLHSQRILILNNGIRQEGQQWGTEHAPEIDPFVAKQIEVIKGAEAVRYGADAMGGVIIISPPPLHNTGGFGGAINTSYQSNSRTSTVSIATEGVLPAPSWSWRIQTSGKYGGDYNTPEYTLSNTGQREFNFSAGLGYANANSELEFYVSSFNARIGILRAAHAGNLQDLNNSIISQRPWYVKDFSFDIQNPYQEINHHLFKTSYKKNLSGNNFIKAVYGLQVNNRKEFDIRRANRGDRPAIAMQLLSQVFDVSLDHVAEKHQGSYGLTTTIKINNNDTETTGIKPLIPDYRQVAAGLFALEKINWRAFTFEAGARADYQYLQALTFTNTETLIKPDFHFYYLSANAGMRYAINSQASLTSNLSFSNRPPHISELFSQGLHHGTATIEEGLLLPNGTLKIDESLFKNERSIKWLNSFAKQSKNFSFEASLYANLIDNYVFLQPKETRLTIRGYFPVFAYKQTKALLAGADLTLNYTFLQNFQLTGKYSYLYGQDVTANQPLIYMPPAQLDTELSWNIPYLSLYKSFLKARVLHVAKQARTPRTINPVDLEGNPPPNETFDFMDAPQAYTLVNLETGFTIPTGEHDITFALACENLTNQRYRNYMNRLRYFADDIGRNFIVRLSYNFYSH
jgi:iron complex outermembrane receptor protein